MSYLSTPCCFCCRPHLVSTLLALASLCTSSNALITLIAVSLWIVYIPGYEIILIPPAASCVDWDIRLTLEDYYLADVSNDISNLYIKEELSVGRVEVCLNGSYGPICLNDLWNNQSVSVVCYQLGFSRYGK